MKRVLVCGAGGFIAGHLVKKLKREGYWVRGVDIKPHEFTPTQADEMDIGAQFVLITFTSRAEINSYKQKDSSLQEMQRVYPAMKGIEWDFQLPEKRMKAFAKEHGMLNLQLNPIFAEYEAQTGKSTHYTFDGHWNATGHMLASEAIFEALKSFGIVRCSNELGDQIKRSQKPLLLRL